MIEFLIFGLVVLSTVCLWLLIDGRKNPKFLAWFIPILLVLVTSTYVTYTSLLGLPKNETPENGLYLSHYVNEPKWIYFWSNFGPQFDPKLINFWFIFGSHFGRKCGP